MSSYTSSNVKGLLYSFLIVLYSFLILCTHSFRDEEHLISSIPSNLELEKQSTLLRAHRSRNLLNNSHPFDFSSLPKASNSMKDLNIILDLLKRGIPFGYSHFNDGEINAIHGCKEGESTDWGWQNCSSGLKKALVQSMRNTAPNFYIGIFKLFNF